MEGSASARGKVVYAQAYTGRRLKSVERCRVKCSDRACPAARVIIYVNKKMDHLARRRIGLFAKYGRGGAGAKVHQKVGDDALDFGVEKARRCRAHRRDGNVGNFASKTCSQRRKPTCLDRSFPNATCMTTCHGRPW